MSISDENSNIFTWENFKSNLQVYTKEGQLQMEEKFPIKYISNIKWLNSCNFLLFAYSYQYDNKGSSIYYYNANEKKVIGLFEMPKLIKSLSYQDYNYVLVYNDEYYIRQPLNHTIYLFNEKAMKLEPKYSIIIGDQANIESFKPWPTGNINDVQLWIKENGIISILDFNEGSDYYMIIYKKSSDVYTHLISKSNFFQKRVVFKTEDDILSYCLPQSNSNNFLIGIIQPYQLLKAIEGNSDKHKTLELLNTLDPNLLIRINENDNPLVLFLEPNL